jgi:hypothetical protein
MEFSPGRVTTALSVHKEIKNVNIETIGSLSQSTRPCPIKYKSMKAQHQQVEVDRSQTLTEFMFLFIVF